MTAAALGVATAIVLLAQSVPSARAPKTSAATSPRVWAHVTFPADPAVIARRVEPTPRCTMPILKGDAAVDPKFVQAPPPGAPRHTMRIIGGDPPLDCPSR